MDEYWEWRRRDGAMILTCESCGEPFEAEGLGLFQFFCPDCQDEEDEE